MKVLLIMGMKESVLKEFIFAKCKVLAFAKSDLLDLTN